MEAPEGFTIVGKGGSRWGNSTGLSASVTGTTLYFSGEAIDEIRGRIDVAINGTRFAVRKNDQGQHALKNRQTAAPRLVRLLKAGKYTGTKEGDWWIFSPVER